MRKIHSTDGDHGLLAGKERAAHRSHDDALAAPSSPLQPQLLSRINEALVLRTIRQHGPLSRGELAQRIGATFPTVAKAVGSLLDAFAEPSIVVGIAARRSRNVMRTTRSPASGGLVLPRD